MSETSIMKVTVQPATENELSQHVVQDESEHAAIAAAEDEDYKWLTERLDAHTSALSRLETLCNTQMTAITESNRNALEESER